MLAPSCWDRGFGYQRGGSAQFSGLMRGLWRGGGGDRIYTASP
ncbi:hypothetical protein P186_1998 [Pyrobaculum ferrireducens]|uniref:Uncharacterized protein n=1 Tax=Pyrobaculum ferrireducens TaxID=1104324 RepID=G7VI34_9CREN|nr:hypothetical protein P186_1998 [Pyrobaculum ferrireducens]